MFNNNSLEVYKWCLAPDLSGDLERRPLAIAGWSAAERDHESRFLPAPVDESSRWTFQHGPHEPSK